MKQPKSPCLGCKRRTPTCHADTSYCDLYAKYRMEQDKYKELVSGNRMFENTIKEITENRYKKP